MILRSLFLFKKHLGTLVNILKLKCPHVLGTPMIITPLADPLTGESYGAVTVDDDKLEMKADSDFLHHFCFAVKMFQVTFVTRIVMAIHTEKGILRRLLLHLLNAFKGID